jgi:hypothetical protein
MERQMKTKLRTFKKLSTAAKAANGKPVVRFGDLYIVGDFASHTQIELMVPTTIGTSHHIVAHVGLGHLERLGNANWATATKPYNGTTKINWND